MDYCSCKCFFFCPNHIVANYCLSPSLQKKHQHNINFIPNSCNQFTFYSRLFFQKTGPWKAWSYTYYKARTHCGFIQITTLKIGPRCYGWKLQWVNHCRANQRTMPVHTFCLIGLRCMVWRRADLVALCAVKQLLKLFLCGCLFLLHELSVTLCDTPAIWSRQGGAQGPTRGWLQGLPVVTTGSE